MLIPSGRRIFPARSRSQTLTLALPHPHRLGCAAMILACALGAICGASFFAAMRGEPGVSPFGGILLRVLCNLICLGIPFCAGRARPRLRRWQGNRGLWCWGVVGVIGTACYYLALPRVGAGLTMFLNAGSGIFVAALAPALTGQRTERAHWIGGLGSLAGLYFLCSPGEGAGSPSAAIGAALALASGLFCGLGYLLVARTRAAYRPETVMLHWTFVNLLAYAGFLFFFPPRWPALGDTWALFLLAGLAGAVSQYFTSVAYQKAPAALVACLTYLSPVLGIALDSTLFGLRFGNAELAGAGLVLAFGLVWPLLSARREAPAAACPK